MLSPRIAKEEEGTTMELDNDDADEQQAALVVYQQTCQKELDDESPQEDEQEILISQSDFADFVWNYCRTNHQFAGPACTTPSTATTNVNSTTIDDEASPPSSFDALPLQVQLAFLPKGDNDSLTGCSQDAPLLEKLNCLMAVNSNNTNPSEAQEAGQTIYLKTSERMNVLCGNATYGLLLESDLLQQSPASTAPPTLQSSLRPGSGASSSSLPRQQHSGLPPGAIAAIVLTALFFPIFMLAMYCWRRKRQHHDEQNSNNLLQIFTKITAMTFDDEPGDVDHHHRHGEENNPALVEDQSVSSENSQAFSPVSAVESNNTDGADEREKSPIASWILNLSPLSSEATQRSFRQQQRTNKSHKKKSTAASNGSVRSHGNSSKGSSRRSRGSNSHDKQSKRLSASFAYPPELHESVVSPGNSS